MRKTRSIAISLLAVILSATGCTVVHGKKSDDKTTSAPPSASANLPSGEPAPLPAESATPSGTNQQPKRPSDNSENRALDPCSLIPANEVRQITGDQGILKPTAPETDYYGYQRCDYAEQRQIGLPAFYVATSHAASHWNFLKIPRSLPNPDAPELYSEKLDLNKSLLKGKADDAFVVYVDPAKQLHGFKGSLRPKHTSRIAILKGNDIIVVHWRGQDTNTRTLEQLALSALKTIDGTRYPGK